MYDDSGRVRLQQLKQLQRLIEPAPTAVLLVGDCNALRRRDYNDQQWAKIVAHDRLRDVVTEHATVDFIEGPLNFEECFAKAGVAWPLCTTWSGRRIDFLFVRGDVQVANPFYLPCTSSDHIPVAVDIIVSPPNT